MTVKTRLVKPLFTDLPPDAAPSGRPVFTAKASQARSATQRVLKRDMPSSDVLRMWDISEVQVFKTNRGCPVALKPPTPWDDVFRGMKHGDCFEAASDHIPAVANAMRKYLERYRLPGKVLARSKVQNTMGAVWFLSNETED